MIINTKFFCTEMNLVIEIDKMSEGKTIKNLNIKENKQNTILLLKYCLKIRQSKIRKKCGIISEIKMLNKNVNAI